MDYNYSLAHHGVKGQKWGVIRSKIQLGHLTGKRGKKISKSTANKKKVKPIINPTPKNIVKSIKDMSDDELRTAINRYQLEKQYKSLYSEMNPKKVSSGKKFVNKVMKNIVGPGTEDIGKQLYKSLLANGVNKALKLDDSNGIEKVYANNKKK